MTAILHEVLNELVGPMPILVTEGISAFGSVEIACCCDWLGNVLFVVVTAPLNDSFL